MPDDGMRLTLTQKVSWVSAPRLSIMSVTFRVKVQQYSPFVRNTFTRFGVWYYGHKIVRSVAGLGYVPTGGDRDAPAWFHGIGKHHFDF
jgi:hypothetical protein